MGIKALCERHSVEILEDAIITIQIVVEMLMDANYKVLKFIQKASWSEQGLTEWGKKKKINPEASISQEITLQRRVLMHHTYLCGLFLTLEFNSPFS